SLLLLLVRYPSLFRGSRSGLLRGRLRDREIEAVNERVELRLDLTLSQRLQRWVAPRPVQKLAPTLLRRLAQCAPEVLESAAQGLRPLALVGPACMRSCAFVTGQVVVAAIGEFTVGGLLVDRLHLRPHGVRQFAVRVPVHACEKEHSTGVNRLV